LGPPSLAVRDEQFVRHYLGPSRLPHLNIPRSSA
jgi:hypothetical protein